MITFERQRVNFGAVTQLDRQQRYGHYYTFFWRATRKADLTVRFEYRQQNLGSYVQAKELTYTDAKGTIEVGVQGDRRRLHRGGQSDRLARGLDRERQNRRADSVVPLELNRMQFYVSATV